LWKVVNRRLMDTCCCIDYDPEDAGTFINVSMRKSRKKYKCYECGEFIKKGDLYEYTRGIWDGAWSTFRTCKGCAKIRKDLFSCGYTYGGLREELQECYGVEL
jgi:hypothetical protein